MEIEEEISLYPSRGLTQGQYYDEIFDVSDGSTTDMIESVQESLKQYIKDNQDIDYYTKNPTFEREGGVFGHNVKGVYKFSNNKYYNDHLNDIINDGSCGMASIITPPPSDTIAHARKTSSNNTIFSELQKLTHSNDTNIGNRNYDKLYSNEDNILFQKSANVSTYERPSDVITALDELLNMKNNFSIPKWSQRREPGNVSTQKQFGKPTRIFSDDDSNKNNNDVIDRHPETHYDQKSTLMVTEARGNFDRLSILRSHKPLQKSFNQRLLESSLDSKSPIQINLNKRRNGIERLYQRQIKLAEEDGKSANRTRNIYLRRKMENLKNPKNMKNIDTSDASRPILYNDTHIQQQTNSDHQKEFERTLEKCKYKNPSGASLDDIKQSLPDSVSLAPPVRKKQLKKSDTMTKKTKGSNTLSRSFSSLESHDTKKLEKPRGFKNIISKFKFLFSKESESSEQGIHKPYCTLTRSSSISKSNLPVIPSPRSSSFNIAPLDGATNSAPKNPKHTRCHQNIPTCPVRNDSKFATNNPARGFNFISPSSIIQSNRNRNAGNYIPYNMSSSSIEAPLVHPHRGGAPQMNEMEKVACNCNPKSKLNTSAGQTFRRKHGEVIHPPMLMETPAKFLAYR